MCPPVTHSTKICCEFPFPDSGADVQDYVAIEPNMSPLDWVMGAFMLIPLASPNVAVSSMEK